ncbi:hypothetical protein [Parachitinimonas caeni]|uniref:Holin n=1 Tax=Parachitinimonas caeni TaxID=3031301 RepID=A0ABT7E2S7_9NEIS|nr:hypothetical protein [Parachitinimonas caeni]MDK2126622.1 hypothetical protein [Parachitinimonas caeni]
MKIAKSVLIQWLAGAVGIYGYTWLVSTPHHGDLMRAIVAGGISSVLYTIWQRSKEKNQNKDTLA